MINDDYPRVFFSRVRLVKATRKAFECNACREEIPAGSSCQYITWMDDMEPTKLVQVRTHPYNCIPMPF